MKVIIIGGVAGGASAAVRLRRLDEKADIIILERGNYVSYANCGLPYYIGGEITEKSALSVQTPESLRARFDIDVRTGNEVVEINPAEKTVMIYESETGTIFSESYDKLILSPGADPIRPSIPGAADPRVFTLRNIPDTYAISEFIKKNKPRRVLVTGAGYIGLEMAENLSKAGLEVIVAELGSHVIAPLDEDMAADVHHYLKSVGIKLLLNNGVQAIIPEKDSLLVQLSYNDISVDMVLMSIGVTPESTLAKSAGLELGPRGAIVVDDTMRTSDENIYAVGDAVQVINRVSGLPGYIPLAGPANKQGRIAADNIAGIHRTYKGTQGSAILKLFDMTVGSTGLNEAGAKAAGFNYDKVFLSPSSHAGYYPGAGTMSMKVMFEKPSGKLLGAQIVGFDGVDKRLDVLGAAISQGLTAEDLTELELAYAPPFSSAKDPVNMAGYVIQNILEGLMRQFHWHDVEGLQSQNAQILDVRTPLEYIGGYIERAMHIPVDDLRENTHFLDKNKPVYIYCQSGIRSYYACRVLEAHGFRTFNLGGGYRLYSSIALDASTDLSCATCG